MGRFSKNLKNLMQKQNLTQQELAEKVGVSQVMITKYLNGGSIPRGETLIAIARVFRVSESKLLTGDVESVTVTVNEPNMQYGDSQKTYYQKTIEVLEQKVVDLMNVVESVEHYSDGLKKLRGTLAKEIEIKNDFIKSIGV
jgi:transcriptional regulator with XRE-family HTH domain